MPTLVYLVWLLTILNQHSEFGCQEISGTEHIKYIKIQYSFDPSLRPWSWKQQSYFYTLTHTHITTTTTTKTPLKLIMTCHLTKVGCKKISSSIDMTETVIYLIIWALTMTLNLKTANLFSCMTLGSMMVQHPTKSGYKSFSNWGDIVELNIHWNA